MISVQKLITLVCSLFGTAAQIDTLNRSRFFESGTFGGDEEMKYVHEDQQMFRIVLCKTKN